jgi:hypothetical protein
MGGGGRCASNEILNRPKPAGCGFLRELPNQGPALPGYCPFLANPVLPTSYQSYPLPTGSQFARGKTQADIIRVRPIWVTNTLALGPAACGLLHRGLGNLGNFPKVAGQARGGQVGVAQSAGRCGAAPGPGSPLTV